MFSLESQNCLSRWMSGVLSLHRYFGANTSLKIWSNIKCSLFSLKGITCQVPKHLEEVKLHKTCHKQCKWNWTWNKRTVYFSLHCGSIVRPWNKTPFSCSEQWWKNNNQNLCQEFRDIIWDVLLKVFKGKKNFPTQNKYWRFHLDSLRLSLLAHTDTIYQFILSLWITPRSSSATKTARIFTFFLLPIS